MANFEMSTIHTAFADRSRPCRDKNYQLFHTPPAGVFFKPKHEKARKGTTNISCVQIFLQKKYISPHFSILKFV